MNVYERRVLRILGAADMIRKPLTCEQISRVLNRVWPCSMPVTVAYVRSYIERLHWGLSFVTCADDDWEGPAYRVTELGHRALVREFAQRNNLP